MIIRKLHIENFGHFHDFTLELGPGLNRLREANEFGKTTLFEFVRRVLWGYPDGRKSQNLNRYPARFNAGEYGGCLELELADGSPVRLERYGAKGKSVLRRADGSEEDGGEFLRRLTPVSGDCYRNVYAVTLDELTMLSSLDGDEIRGRLYGGAITGEGVSLPKLGKDLDERSKALYKQRGWTSEIGSARQELRDVRERRDQAVAEAARRVDLERELVDLEREVSHLRAEADRCAEAAAATELLLKAHPRYVKLAETEAELAALPPCRDVPATEARRAESLAGRLAQIPPSPPVDASRQAVLAAEAALLDRELAAAGGAAPPPKEDDLAAAKELGELAARVAKTPVFPFWIMIPTAVSILAAAAAVCLVHPWRIAAAAVGTAAAVAAAFGVVVALRRRSGHRRLEKELEERYAAFEERLSLDCPPENCVAVLNSRLRRREVAAELASLQTAQSAHERATALKRELEELCRSFGCADAAEVARMAQANARANELRRRRAELAAALDALLPPEKQSVLAHFDPETEAKRGAEAAARRAELEKSILLIHQKAGAAANELKHLPGAEEIELFDSEIGQAKSALRRLVRDYLVVRTCRAFLDAAVDRYERESQPEVFKRAETLFSGFTAGRYTRVYKKLATGELTVCDAHTGLEKTFTALSRGTREELMLAMRLALIECTELDSEPLPVCFDDVGVNFDPERLRRVEAAVADFASGRQVIWFSHS